MALRDELNDVRRARAACIGARRAAWRRGARVRLRLRAHPWILMGAGFGAGALAGRHASRSPGALPGWLAPLAGVLARTVLARVLGV